MIVANVPVVGNVTAVVLVMVNVEANAPLVVRLPPRVMVLPVLATPVPPYWPATNEPCHVPVPMVPTDVSDEETTLAASVVPVRVPAGAMTAAVLAAVKRPFASKVRTGIAVEDPADPAVIVSGNSNVKAENDSEAPTVIASAAPVRAVVRPSSFAVGTAVT